MKKIIIMLSFFSFFMLGCESEETNIENENLDKVDNKIEEKVDNENTNNDINEDYFKQIDALKFKEMFNSKGKYIFFIGRDNCPACQMFKPTAIEFSSKEKTDIYYVNTTEFKEDDWQIIQGIVKVKYIPTIVISNDANILYNEHGVKSYDSLKEIVTSYYKGR